MREQYNNITLLNSAQMPCDGLYNKRSISKNQFVEIVKKATKIKSSIGYDTVSKLVKHLTGINVPVDRGTTYINEGDTIVGLTLNYRVNSTDKGYHNPTEDDYIYFVAKYTKDEKSIQIELKNAKLTISDNGIGMDEGEVFKVFDRYYQSDSEKKGSGIGLYMIKQILE